MEQSFTRKSNKPLGAFKDHLGPLPMRGSLDEQRTHVRTPDGTSLLDSRLVMRPARLLDSMPHLGGATHGPACDGDDGAWHGSSRGAADPFDDSSDDDDEDGRLALLQAALTERVARRQDKSSLAKRALSVSVGGAPPPPLSPSSNSCSPAPGARRHGGGGAHDDGDFVPSPHASGPLSATAAPASPFNNKPPVGRGSQAGSPMPAPGPLSRTSALHGTNSGPVVIGASRSGDLTLATSISSSSQPQQEAATSVHFNLGGRDAAARLAPHSAIPAPLPVGTFARSAAPSVASPSGLGPAHISGRKSVPRSGTTCSFASELDEEFAAGEGVAVAARTKSQTLGRRSLCSTSGGDADSGHLLVARAKSTLGNMALARDGLLAQMRSGPSSASGARLSVAGAASLAVAGGAPRICAVNNVGVDRALKSALNLVAPGSSTLPVSDSLDLLDDECWGPGGGSPKPRVPLCGRRANVSSLSGGV